MSGGRMLHFELHLTVTGIHVVELLDAGGPEVGLLLGVEVFIQMEQLSLPAQEKPQGIESCILVVMFPSLHRKGMEQRGLHEQDGAKVEVVADTAREVVDGRMAHQLSLLQGVVIGIDHGRIRIAGSPKQPVQRMLAQGELRILRDEQGIVGLGILRDTHQRVAARQIGHTKLAAIVLVLSQFRNQQENILHGLAVTQLTDYLHRRPHVVAGQETIYFFSHFCMLYY